MNVEARAAFDADVTGVQTCALPIFADELHRQYLLGYKMPDRDGRQHQIDVRIKGRTGLDVHARKGYFAPKTGTVQ